MKESEKQYANQATGGCDASPNVCVREYTPKEILGQKIEQAEVELRDLRALHAALPDAMAYPAERLLRRLIRKSFGD